MWFRGNVIMLGAYRLTYGTGCVAGWGATTGGAAVGVMAGADVALIVVGEPPTAPPLVTVLVKETVPVTTWVRATAVCALLLYC